MVCYLCSLSKNPKNDKQMIEQIQGYDTSEAVKYHYGAFPPRNLNYEILVPLISRAAASLARYDAVLRNLHNQELLLAPLRRQEAVVSSRMEGTIATLEEVLKFEAEKTDGNEDNNSQYRAEILEVHSYARALTHAQNLMKNGLSICGRLMRETHGRFLFLGRGSDKQPGVFKAEQNYVADKIKKKISFIPVSPDKLNEGITSLENFLNDQKYEPLIQTALSHVEFEALHPFKDGNGRVGRMLVTLGLWSKELISAPHFYVSSTIEENKDEYIERLRLVSADGQWTEWCMFFLNVIEKQAKKNLEVAGKIGDLYQEMKTTFRKELASKWIVEALDYIFGKPVFKNSTFIAKTGIPPATVARFTKVLANKKLLATLEEASGRRPALYAFEPLLKIVRSQ